MTAPELATSFASRITRKLGLQRSLPDSHSLTYPTWLKQATAEFAKWLLAEDRTAEASGIGIKQMSVGSLKIVNDKYDEKSIIPPIVAKMIAFYGTVKSKTQHTLERIY